MLKSFQFMGCSVIGLWGKEEYTVKPVLSGHSKRSPKLVFKTDYHLMQVKSIAECSKGSILQYFRLSLSYHLSLRYFFLFLSEWPLKTGFTVYYLCQNTADKMQSGITTQGALLSWVKVFRIITEFRILRLIFSSRESRPQNLFKVGLKILN